MVSPSLVGIANVSNAIPTTSSINVPRTCVTHSPTSPRPQITRAAWWRRTPIHRFSASAAPSPRSSLIEVPADHRTHLVGSVRYVAAPWCRGPDGRWQLLSRDDGHGRLGGAFPHTQTQ